MAAYRIQTVADVTSTGYDELIRKQESASTSTKKLDSDLTSIKSKLTALVGAGEISVGEATGLNRIIGQYQKLGITAQDALNTIRRNQEQYGAETSALASRVEQSVRYQQSIELRAAAAREEARNRELASIRAFQSEQNRILNTQRIQQSITPSSIPLALSGATTSSPILALPASTSQGEEQRKLDEYRRLALARTQSLRIEADKVADTTSRSSNLDAFRTAALAQFKKEREQAEIKTAEDYLRVQKSRPLDLFNPFSAAVNAQYSRGSILGLNALNESAIKPTTVVSPFGSGTGSTSSLRRASEALADPNFALNIGGTSVEVGKLGEAASRLKKASSDASGTVHGLSGTLTTDLYYAFGPLHRTSTRVRHGINLLRRGISGGFGGGDGDDEDPGNSIGFNPLSIVQAARSGGGAGGAGGIGGLVSRFGVGGVSGGAVLAGGAAIGGIALVSSELVKYADATAKAAQEDTNLALKTGLTVTQIGLLRGASELAGTHIESLAIGIKGLAKAQEEAATGGGPGGDALKKLGIAATDADGRLRPTYDVLLDISKAVKGLDDQQAVSLVEKLIPGRGAELVPLFRRNLEGLIEVAERLGIAFTADGARKADSFRQKLAELSVGFKEFERSAGGIGINILNYLFPTDQQLALRRQKFQNALKDLGRAAILQNVSPADGDQGPKQSEAQKQSVVDGIKARVRQNGVLRRQFEADDYNTLEGAQDKVSQSRRRAESARQAALAPDAATGDPKDQKALNQAAKEANDDLVKQEAHLKSIQDAKSHSKATEQEVLSLRREYNHSLEGELDGVAAINQKYNDRISQLQEQDRLNGTNIASNKQVLSLLAQIRDIETERYNRRATLQTFELENRKTESQAANSNTVAVNQQRNRVALERVRRRKGGTELSPSGERDQALEDYNISETNTYKEYTNSITEITHKQEELNKIREQGGITELEYQRKIFEYVTATGNVETKFQVETQNNATELAKARAAANNREAKERDELSKATSEREIRTAREVSNLRGEGIRNNISRRINLLDAQGNDDSNSNNILGLRALGARSATLDKLSALQDEFQSASREPDGKEKEDRLLQIRLAGLKEVFDYEQTILDLRAQQEDRIAAKRKADENAVRGFGEGLFDASRSGGRGIQQFFQNTALSQVRTIAGNVSASLFRASGSTNPLSNLIGGQTRTKADGTTELTGIGQLFKGTLLGHDTAQDKVNIGVTSIDLKAGSMDKNIAAILALLQQVNSGNKISSTSTLPGGFSAPGSTTNLSSLFSLATPTFNGSTVQEAIGSARLGFGIDPNTGFNSRTPISPDTIAALGAAGIFLPQGAGSGSSSGSVSGSSSSASYSGLSGVFSGLKRPGDIQGIVTGDGVNADGSAESLSPSERVGSAVATGAVVYEGIKGVAAGVKKGGAYGTFGAISSAAATAAAVDPEPVSKGALEIAAVVSKGIQFILGDPVQKRLEGITKELNNSQFSLPTSQSRTQSLEGNYVDFDSRGNARNSPFSPIPVVQQPYIDPYHNLVPGVTPLPFGGGVGGAYSIPDTPAPINTSATPNPVIQPIINIQTYGPKDLHDYLQSNPDVVNAAIGTALRTPGPAQAAVRDTAIGV